MFSFKLINIAGSILERPIIQKEIMNRYVRIQDMLTNELNTVETLFNNDSFNTLFDLPPLASFLKFSNMLKQRIDQPIQVFLNLQHP